MFLIPHGAFNQTKKLCLKIPEMIHILLLLAYKSLEVMRVLEAHKGYPHRMILHCQKFRKMCHFSCLSSAQTKCNHSTLHKTRVSICRSTKILQVVGQNPTTLVPQCCLSSWSTICCLESNRSKIWCTVWWSTIEYDIYITFSQQNRWFYQQQWYSMDAFHILVDDSWCIWKTIIHAPEISWNKIIVGRFPVQS
jgi:hypothetical protein